MANPKSTSKETAERLARIETTLDVVRDNQKDHQQEIKLMNKTLAVNTEQLAVHIQGVKLAREQNDLLKKDVDSRFEQLAKDNLPLQDHVKFVHKLSKFAMYILSPAAIYYIIKIGQELLGWLHK